MECIDEATYQTLDGLHSWDWTLGYRWQEQHDQQVMDYIYDFIDMWHSSSICMCLEAGQYKGQYHLTVQCLLRKRTRAKKPHWKLTLLCDNHSPRQLGLPCANS